MNSSIAISSDCFTPFSEPVDHIELPSRFTFPFYYTPHPLSIIAAKELQKHLEHQNIWIHNFGLDDDNSDNAIGKMFGVLVVRKGDQMGFLSAFSGKLADSNDHEHFVPPIYDTLMDHGFFNKGQLILNGINQQIEQLELNPELHKAKELLKIEKELAENDLRFLRNIIKTNKKKRKEIRQQSHLKTDNSAFNLIKQKHTIESLEHQRELKYRIKYWEIRIFYKKIQLDKFKNEIDRLKSERKKLSGKLQKQIFDQYNFLNQSGQSKNVLDIFKNTVLKKPPAGAGECAAPKLLQYAFQHHLDPIAMAEFWWGASPKSEIRQHGQFYPACRGKCEPILAHMLEGLILDNNPMLLNPAKGKCVEIIFEDEHMLVVNKPAEFLSVPGKIIEDSVWLRMKNKFPRATGPLIVHRLDMSTSGLMVIAKTKEVHKVLQSQFIKRTVQKRYVALLDGIFEDNEGAINLPICLDYNDRPRQMVSPEYGKSARTEWKVIHQKNNQTRIHFFPITGRTHQLRVHAAHVDGLNTPILGDDLYGKRSDRLYLHAEQLIINHPLTGKRMTFNIQPSF